MYCCEFCEIFKNTFSTEHLQSTAKSYLYSSVCSVLKSVYPNPLKRTWELPSLVVVIVSKIRNKCIYKLLHYLIDRPYFILHYFAINVLLQGTWPYSEFFWSIFSGNRTEYGDLLCRTNQGKCGPENLGIRTLFMQWKSRRNTSKIKHKCLKNKITFTWNC